MYARIRIPLFALATGFLIACATLVNDSPQTVPITSDPPGASVTIDGVSQGVTPMRTKLPVKGDHTVTVEAAGYPARTVTVESSMGVGYIILDVLFGVVPLVVDLYTGDLYNLNPGNLHFQFAPVPVRKAAPPPRSSQPRQAWPTPKSRARRGGNAPRRGGSSGHCCINGSYYSCPNTAAIAQCAPPQLASCMMSCGMTDASCPDECLSKYRPDPSSCTREPAQDNQCKR